MRTRPRIGRYGSPRARTARYGIKGWAWQSERDMLAKLLDELAKAPTLVVSATSGLSPSPERKLPGGLPEPEPNNADPYEIYEVP